MTFVKRPTWGKAKLFTYLIFTKLKHGCHIFFYQIKDMKEMRLTNTLGIC